MMKRRSFILNGAAAAAGLSMPSWLNASPHDHDLLHLTILHTNDMHSRIEPFPMDGSRNEGQGGMARRASMIERVRKAEDHVLLFDSGDIFQGTPYFNFFGGELEIKLMSQMKYDAATIGNHDFDGGMEGLLKQIPNASFPFLSTNYNFNDTIIHGLTKPYQIFNVEHIKIGVFGLGIELDGLVPKDLYQETQYQDPIEEGNKMADFLKQEMDCDLVVCLSHLGYRYRDGKVSDVVLAENSSSIDIILGGHTHTFMSEPDIRRNFKGKEVVINQAGWAGIMLGRLDIIFEKNRKGTCLSCKNTFVV